MGIQAAKEYLEVENVDQGFGAGHHRGDCRCVHQSKLVVESPQQLAISNEEVEIQEEEEQC
jgi:hypothetical protein